MTWIVVKQYFLTGSQDPDWATKQQFWSQLSGSGDTQTFSFDNETEACLGGIDEKAMRVAMCVWVFMVHLTHGFMDYD